MPHPVRGRCRIKSLLLQIGKNQTWLAKKMGKQPQQLSDWLNDRSPMNIDAAKIVVEILREYINPICIDDLYEWSWED